MTRLPGRYCGRCCRSIGWGDPYSGPSNLCTPKARAVSGFSAVSQTCYKWGLAAARAAQSWRRGVAVWWAEDCIAAFCRWCRPDGTIGLWPSTFTGSVRNRVWTGCEVLIPSEGVQVSWDLVLEWGYKGTWDGPENRSSGSGFAFTLPHRGDEKRAESEGKALNLLVNLRS